MAAKEGNRGCSPQIIAAVITACGAILVALITISGPQTTPAPGPSPAPFVDPNPAPAPVAGPADISGNWRSADGEVLQIQQSGGDLQIDSQLVTPNGMVVMTGGGRIEGREARWTVNSNVIPSMDCTARVSGDGAHLIGACNLAGRNLGFSYSR